MGFGKKSRREAKAGQEAALRQQQQAFEETQRLSKLYREGFEKRNAGIIAMQERANRWLADYDKGVDVAKLNPALANTLRDTADIMTRTTQVANRIGNNALVRGDKGFQNKLQSVAQRDMFKNMAIANEQGLMEERGNQTNIAMQTSQFLNQDTMAGIGLQNDVFNQSNALFGNWTTKRNIEIARGNMMTNMLMQGIMGGVSGFATAGGAKGLWATGGVFGKKQ